MTYLDAQFGRLIEALEKSNQLENTLIIFTGDSGLAVGQHGLLGKQNLYDDAGVHVPLILAGPGVPQNQRRSALGTTCDIFPTLCDLTGITTPTSIDGQSMMPLLLDSGVQTRECIYLAYREYQRAVVEPRYKLVEYVQATKTVKGQTQTAGTRFTQLFDLQQDPWETTNLAHDPVYISTRQRLQLKLLKLRQEHDDGTAHGKILCPEMHELYKLFWDNYK